VGAPRIVLTAGFDRALHVVALAELATRAGHEIALVLVVDPFRIARLRAFVRQRGVAAVAHAARRIAGPSPHEGARPDPLLELLRSHEIAARSLRRFCRERGAAYRKVADLNAPDAVAALRAARADGVVYGGGGILKRAFLDAAAGRVLNAHSGPLPEVRGMNACEWSLLLGLEPCVTIHVIERGIDTGGEVDRIPLALEPGDDLERLRAKCAVLGVKGLLRSIPRLAGELPRARAGAGAHRQCFVLAPALRELAERRLAERLARPPGAGA
jgi:folate-dependent phosphoribosylglycinamide formyltransferase PurN